MKFLTVLVIAMSASAFAGHHEGKMHKMEKLEEMKKLPFEQHKKIMTEMIDKKSAMVEKNRKCIHEAKDNNALNTCHDQINEERHVMKEELKDQVMDAKKKL